MPAAAGKDKENYISRLGLCAKIVATDPPGRRRTPEMGIIVNPRTLLTTNRPVHRLERTCNIDESFHWSSDTFSLLNPGNPFSTAMIDGNYILLMSFAVADFSSNSATPLPT